eukprot:gene18144-19954_t
MSLGSVFTFNTTTKDSSSAYLGNNVLSPGKESSLTFLEMPGVKNKFHEAPKESSQETNGLKMPEGFIHELKYGSVEVIHNFCFPKRKDAWREGSDEDLKAIHNFFDVDRGFKFRTHEDLKADQMFQLAKDISEKDFSKMDSFFFFILSHGNEKGILGVDEEPLPIEAITGLFTADKCPTLANKPKFFIIQACRGEKDDQGAIVPDADSFCPSPPPVPAIPVESDFLVAYSSPPGYLSLRDKENGTWFIQNLMRVFQDFYTQEHVMDMFLMVNFLIAKVLSTTELKQMPLQECRLTKKCYFSK